jgi:hypothetical protein
MVIRYVLVHRPSGRASPAEPDVERCIVQFRLDDIRRGVDAVAAGAWKEPRGQGTPVVNTWKRHHPHRLLEWLEAQAKTTAVIEIQDGRWRSWGDVSRSMLAQRSFASISCERCGREYSADEIRDEPHEEYHGPLDAIGGRRHLCPSGHHLYFVVNWIS